MVKENFYGKSELENLKEEIKQKALEVGFSLCGVSDIKKVETVEFPPDRGLMRPSEVMPDAKSLVVMGFVMWDEGLNTAVATPSTGDFTEGGTIIPGPSFGVPPGEKVIYDKCVVAHELDKDIDEKWEKYIRRITERGFMECTICNLACPYGKSVDEKIIPAKRGIV